MRAIGNMKRQTVSQWIREQAMKGRLFFTREELLEAFPNKTSGALSVELLRASKSRLISIAWRGFYLILPPIYVGQGTLPITMYLDALMKYMKRPYCVALLNAAAFYGAAHQSPQTFTVMTSDPIPRARLKHGTQLEFVGKREFRSGIPKELIREFKTPTGYVNVSSPEYTALSLIQHSSSVGGLSRALSVMEELLEECNFREMPGSICSYIPQSCFQRLGYMVEELLGDAEQANDLYAFIKTHGSPLKKTIFSLESAKKDGTINERWKLVINEFPESDLL